MKPILPSVMLLVASSCGGGGASLPSHPVDAELARLGLHPVGPETTLDVTLPSVLDDANYGLKALVCHDGGYDLTSAAGTQVVFHGLDVAETCQGNAARAWVVLRGNDVVCAYMSVRPDSSLVPGIWAANDPSCHG